jgi:hypothetical protein
MSNEIVGMKAQEKLEQFIIEKHLYDGDEAEQWSRELAKSILSNTELIRMIVEEMVEIDIDELSDIILDKEDNGWCEEDVRMFISDNKSKILKIKEGK